MHPLHHPGGWALKLFSRVLFWVQVQAPAGHMAIKGYSRRQTTVLTTKSMAKLLGQRSGTAWAGWTGEHKHRVACLDVCICNWPKNCSNTKQFIQIFWSSGRLNLQLIGHLPLFLSSSVPQSLSYSSLAADFKLNPSSSPCLSSGNHSPRPWLFQKIMRSVYCKGHGRAPGAVLRHSLAW